jgi:hypothetical protein
VHDLDGERTRDSPPPICSRQELSRAHSTSAWVEPTAATLSASIASDTSEFLIAKVPPKPQHDSAAGSSASSRPATAPSRRNGRSPTRSARSEWQVG